MKAKIKLLNDKAVVPFKNYDSDFMYDCVATSCEEIAPNVFKYGLGIALQIDSDYIKVMKKGGYNLSFDIRPRSSIYKTGMVLANSCGTIDEGYTNEIFVIFYKVVENGEPYRVGDRVCQVKLGMSANIDFKVVEELEERERGLKGFGSTGK